MTHLKKLILTTLLVLFTLSAVAMDLNTAKSRGFWVSSRTATLDWSIPAHPVTQRALCDRSTISGGRIISRSPVLTVLI